jgi:peptide chain release factor 2
MADAERDIVRAENAFHTLEMQSLLNSKLDRNNAYVTLHAGAGGTESCDWASMLLRMFQRYCSNKGFEVELIDVQSGDEAGIKNATLAVRGLYAYGLMKCERGVHRLVRISPFDSNKRRHTSFVSLDVVAELDDDIEVEILDKDLRVDTYRSSGSGGQHVNKTDSAIRITHLPSGIVVSCQAERSQHANRNKVMKILKARLYELELDKQRKEMERFYGQKGEISWGSQIRSYVLQPYTMVKDHRTDCETSNVQAVLDGALDPFIDAYLKQQKAQATGK